MVKVTFVSEDITAEVPEGTSLQDTVEMANSQFPFGCRHGSCGACRCVLIEGHMNVNDLTDAEEELFESLTSVGQHERLGCQLIVKGDIKVRA